jgi:hypothetical protein
MDSTKRFVSVPWASLSSPRFVFPLAWRIGIHYSLLSCGSYRVLCLRHSERSDASSYIQRVRAQSTHACFTRCGRLAGLFGAIIGLRRKGAANRISISWSVASALHVARTEGWQNDIRVRQTPSIVRLNTAYRRYCMYLFLRTGAAGDLRAQQRKSRFCGVI